MRHSLPTIPTGVAFLPPEVCVRHEYNAKSKLWESKQTTVMISPTPFAQGGMRFCVHVQEVEPDGGVTPMIGKFFLPDCRATVDDYFHEASMQCCAEALSQEYNRRQETPKKISFLPCYVVRRPNGTYFIMEPMMRGNFEKHNNNFGEVYSVQETPEAFSHFTYQLTNKTLLVCDIQGVGDVYTDPQIHTPSGTDYGMGNMGAEGIQRWKSAHRCNSICRALRLLPLGPPATGGVTPPRTNVILMSPEDPGFRNDSMTSYFQHHRLGLTADPYVPRVRLGPARPAPPPPPLPPPPQPIRRPSSGSGGPGRVLDDEERLRIAIERSKVEQ
eukprot:PhF_6_TR19999/c0_g1_i1/m.29185/K08292/EEF2K; elongation factor 2 kinase